jgi:hypothetical protein
MRADIHDGPEHTLQAEAGYIDARPLSAGSTKASCNARPDHTLGQRLKSSRRAYVFRFAANTDIAALCCSGRHRFASGMTLLAAGCGAGPSEGRVLRVVSSVKSRIDAVAFIAIVALIASSTNYL